MNKSDSIVELSKALHAAQGEMSGAKKGAKNPFFNSSYADLGAVVDAVRTPFFNHGLSYSQFPVYQDGMAGVVTILMHTSGEWIESTLLLPVGKKDAQATGSAITYARRYALQSIAGIPSEDDDGNAASQQNQRHTANTAGNPDIDLIKDAVKRKDFDFIRSEWGGVIAAQWGNLTPEQQAILNKMNEANPS